MALFRCGGGSAKYKEDDHTFTAIGQTHDVVCDFDIKYVVLILGYDVTTSNARGFITYFWDTSQTNGYYFWGSGSGSLWDRSASVSNFFSLPNSKTLRVTAATANWVYPIKVYCFG